MEEKLSFSDLESIISLDEKMDEEFKSIDESPMEDDNSSQFEEAFLKGFIDKGKALDDISISDINNDEDKIPNNSNENIKFDDEINNNSQYIKNADEIYNNSNYDIFGLNSMDFSRFENSMGLINEKKNLTLSQSFDFSYVINQPFINTTKKKKKKKTNKDNFISNKRLFDIAYPKDFIIFNKGRKDNQIRQYIDEVQEKDKLEDIFSSKKEKIHSKNDFDNIRKKIKTRFLKSLKNQVNVKLRSAGSNKIFSYLPQKFVRSVSKKINKEVLDLTFKELYSKNFSLNNDESYANDPNLNKYNYNKSMLDYLEKRKNICEKSDYINFKNMKYYQIFEEYLRSKEFENEISKLKDEENNEYIEYYIKLAYNLNYYFNN